MASCAQRHEQQRRIWSYIALATFFSVNHIEVRGRWRGRSNQVAGEPFYQTRALSGTIKPSLGHIMKDLVISILRSALQRAHQAGKLGSAEGAIAVEAPRDPAHGDIASNLALTRARPEGKAPRLIANIIKEHLELPPEVSEANIAGPGFINFKMAPAYWHRALEQAAARGLDLVRPQTAVDRKVQVEFLSANPTGPLTVGHGRNAVLGDTIARLYEAMGCQVTREYYFNNGGRQMRLLGESVRVRYLQELGRQVVMPEDGYQGDYIREIAHQLYERQGAQLENTPADAELFRSAAEAAIFADIRRTCERLGIGFDVYTNELDLIRDGRVSAVLEGLRKRGLLEDRDGAVWLRGDKLNLPNNQDQVLVRSTGEPTYRTPDIAYHIDKLQRGFDLVIDVFGADHIAEHEGVIAAVRTLGYNVELIRAIIYQFVTLTRGGEKIKMSTRKAAYVTLDELLDEVGADVARFFFLFRKHDSHLDFDLDLAKRQAPENPVFYVQYAHARLASVFREAEKAGLPPVGVVRPALDLLSEEEMELAKKAIGIRELVVEATSNLEPHRIPFYLLEMAGDFHRYYNKPVNRIIDTECRDISVARLFLAQVLKNAIAGGLGLLGVSAPERM
jgi:arginyl-tRNA synthetase